MDDERAGEQIDIYEVWTKEGGHFWLLPPYETPIWDDWAYPVKPFRIEERVPEDWGPRGGVAGMK